MSNLPVNIRTVQPGPEPRRILSIVQHGLHSSETTSSASPARRRLHPRSRDLGSLHVVPQRTGESRKCRAWVRSSAIRTVTLRKPRGYLVLTPQRSEGFSTGKFVGLI